MAAENILGLVLEEYIHEKMIGRGWAGVWGNSIPAVDCCSSGGDLLQVKNRSNTENSSSNKIRAGTKIEKWFRVDARNGATKWPELTLLLGVDQGYLSEEGFISFASNLLERNPRALYCDEGELLGLFKE